MKEPKGRVPQLLHKKWRGSKEDIPQINNQKLQIDTDISVLTRQFKINGLLNHVHSN